MKNEKGITLVELLGVLAITGIISVDIMSVYSTGANSSERTTSRQQLQQEANVIVEQIRSSYIENEKTDLVNDQFLVKVEDDKLMITTIDELDVKILSTNYLYKLAESLEEPEIIMNRTKVSPFYLEICSNDQ